MTAGSGRAPPVGLIIIRSLAASNPKEHRLSFYTICVVKLHHSRMRCNLILSASSCESKTITQNMENNYSYLFINIPKWSIRRGDGVFLYRIEFPRFVADGDDGDDVVRDSISVIVPTAMPRTEMMANPQPFRTFRTSPTLAFAFGGREISSKNPLLPPSRSHSPHFPHRQRRLCGTPCSLSQNTKLLASDRQSSTMIWQYFFPIIFI
jgi:hypothetical protein